MTASKTTKNLDSVKSAASGRYPDDDRPSPPSARRPDRAWRFVPEARKSFNDSGSSSGVYGAGGAAEADPDPDPTPSQGLTILQVIRVKIGHAIG